MGALELTYLFFVIAGFIPATHCSARPPVEEWVPAMNAGMTKGGGVRR